MNNQDLLNKDQMVARVSFLNEMISEKRNQAGSMIESLKRVEGHANGSKELSEKISGFIKKQQSDLTGLVSQQKLQQEIAKFIERILESTRDFVRSSCSDVEKVYFAKQGEFIYIQQEIEKLSLMKLNLEQKIKSMIEAEVAAAEQKEKEKNEVKQEEPTKIKRKRPDQDETTRVGRAALDIAERKRKYKKRNE